MLLRDHQVLEGLLHALRETAPMSDGDPTDHPAIPFYSQNSPQAPPRQPEARRAAVRVFQGQRPVSRRAPRPGRVRRRGAVPRERRAVAGVPVPRSHLGDAVGRARARGGDARAARVAVSIHCRPGDLAAVRVPHDAASGGVPRRFVGLLVVVDAGIRAPIVTGEVRHLYRRRRTG